MPLDVVVVGPDGRKAGVGEGQRVELAAPAPVLFSDSPNIDAFGRLRVSNPQTIFDSTLQYGVQALQWETVTTSGGSATHLPNESSARLRVDTSSDASCIRQTYQYHRYQPGKSQMVTMTFMFGATNTNVTKHVGYFDDENGIFLGQKPDGTVIVCRRSKVTGSVVDEAILQSHWNLDRFDGSGPSGIALDWSKAQILTLDMEWLGTGRVRLGFIVSGQVHYAHQFEHANVLATPYMTTANLPIRYAITADGAAGATTDLIQTCCMVTSEGGFEIGRGLPFSATTGASGVSTGTGGESIVAIRPRTTFNSITNRALVIVESLDVYVTGQDIYWALVYKPTITAGSWGDHDTNNSTLEVNTTATAFSGGLQIATGFIKVSAHAQTAISSLVASRNPIALDKAGASQALIVALVAYSFTGTATVYGSLSWRELY